MDSHLFNKFFKGNQITTEFSIFNLITVDIVAGFYAVNVQIMIFQF